MKTPNFKKVSEAPHNYHHVLINYSSSLLYIFLLFGIHIRVWNPYKPTNSTSKWLSLLEKVARIFFCLFRAVMFLLVTTLTMCSFDWTYNIIKICDIGRCILLVSLISTIFCSAITYLYMFYKQDSISKFLQDLLDIIGSQVATFSDSNVCNQLKAKIRIIAFALLFDMILCCLVCITHAFIYFERSKISNPFFNCELYSGLLITLGCNFYTRLTIASISYCIFFFISYIAIVVHLFFFTVLLINIHFNIFISHYSNVNGFLKLHLQNYVADVVRKHKEYCNLIKKVNYNFSFLIFVWFTVQIFQFICLLRVNTGKPAVDQSMSGIFLIGVTVQFLTTCLVVSSVNSKVRFEDIIL